MRNLAIIIMGLVRGASADPLWGDHAGGYQWTLDSVGLHVSKKGDFKTVWSRENFDTAAATERGCTVHGKFRVVSLVGPFLTYEIRRDEKCPPSESVTESVEWSVVNANEAAPAKLTELFSENELFGALRKHPLLNAPKTKNVPAPIRSLAGIESQLGASTFVFERGNQQCYASFDRVLERFAPWKLEDGKVLVHLQVPLEGSAACTEAPLELELSLRVSPASRQMIELAESKQEGFTAHHSERMNTVLEINPGAHAPGQNKTN